MTAVTGRAGGDHVRRGRRLEYFTIGWNVIEACIALASGIGAGSAALVGFGIDSAIESSSGAVLLWRLHDRHGEAREGLALKLVGISFLLLGAYVAFDAGQSLLLQQEPEASYVGIGLAAVSLVVMPLLARAKRKVAVHLGSRALEADSRQTDLCAYLSAILLGGLALNALFGWWWADPVAGLIMVPIIAREGVEALRGETCDDCSPAYLQEAAAYLQEEAACGDCHPAAEAATQEEPAETGALTDRPA